MLAKDHSPYRNRALEKTVEERDTARKELISRIEQCASLTWMITDCRARLDESIRRERVLESERDRLKASNTELLEALEFIYRIETLGAVTKATARAAIAKAKA